MSPIHLATFVQNLSAKTFKIAQTGHTAFDFDCVKYRENYFRSHDHLFCRVTCTSFLQTRLIDLVNILLTVETTVFIIRNFDLIV